jgi:hypothetical protein
MMDEHKTQQTCEDLPGKEVFRQYDFEFFLTSKE